MPIALITGINGQDGSYLTELLHEKGYEVHGLLRGPTSDTRRIDHIPVSKAGGKKNLVLHHGDLADSSRIVDLLNDLRPDEIYNLAAQSSVHTSFADPEYTGNVDGLGPLRILEGIRKAALEKKVRFYQASSSEMFGEAREVPQTEETSFCPYSPYGCAKVYAFWLTVNYRKSYGLHASNGILFNHESPRRGEDFVTRKITRAAARIKVGLQEVLYLGRLDARRDWGYAPDYVDAMWRMIQQDVPDDYVIATNESHSILQFCQEAFKYLDLDWKQFVKYDKRYERPAEGELLVGNPAKAKKCLDWEPKTRFDEIVRIMVDADMRLAEREVGLDPEIPLAP